MTVEEVVPGLWRWTAPHPEWKEGDDWPREVGCVYYEAPDATVLVDPLVPEDPAERERFHEALDRDVARRGLPVAIVLTCDWHERSAEELAERHRASREAVSALHAHELPEIEERLWWIPEHRALVPGDVLLGDGGGLSVCPDSWLGANATHDSIRAALRPLLDLPVERILVSHGTPVLANGRAALERALGLESL